MPSYFAPFDLSSRDADGSIAPIANAALDVRTRDGEFIGVVNSDAYGYVAAVELPSESGTEIEFYHDAYTGALRQTTAAAPSLAFSPILNFIIDDQTEAFMSAASAEVWVKDLSGDLPPQYLADISPGAEVSIPYPSNTAKNVKLFLVSKSGDGQTSDADFATAESAIVSVSGAGGSHTLDLAELIAANDGNFTDTALDLNDDDLYPDDFYTLNVSSRAVFTEDFEIPGKFLVTRTNNGIIEVTGGAEVVINNFNPIGNIQFFDCWNGGMVRLLNVEEYNVAWWHGTDAEADASDGVDDIIASIQFSNSPARVFFPVKYETSGGHDLVSGFSARSTGINVIDETGGGLTCFEDNTYIFKVGGNLRNINLEDLTLECTGSNSEPFLCEGAYPNSTFGVHCRRVFFSGGKIGHRVHSLHTTGDPWEFMNSTIEDCFFIHQTEACRRQNTNNNGIQDKNNYYFLTSPNFVAVDLELAGTVVNDGGTFVGTGATPANTLPTDGTYAFRTTGLFQVFVLKNIQTENIQGLYKNNGNNYGQVGMVVENSLIQCYLDFNANATVYSRNNYYVNYGIHNYRNGNGWLGGAVNSLPVAVIVHSYGDTVENRTNAGDHSLNGFSNPNGTHYSYIATQQTPGQEFTTYKNYHHFEFEDGAGGSLDKPVARFAGQLDDKAYLGIGNTDSSGNFYGYTIRRKSDGKLHFKGNQAGFENYVFDDGIVTMPTLSVLLNATIAGTLIAGEIQSTANASFGIYASLAKLNAFSTGTQLAIGYSLSVYATIAQNSSGVVTLDAVGATPKFSFADPVEVSGNLSTTGTLNAVSGFQVNGTSLNTSHIPDSTNKRYVTDAEKAAIGSTSGALLATNNLSDLGNALTARTNLGVATTANQTDSTNKRFVTDAEKAAIGKIPRTLFTHYSNASDGGSNSGLYLDYIPGNTLNNDGESLEFVFTVSFGAGLNSKQIYIYFGSILLFDSTPLANASVDFKICGWIFRTSSNGFRATVELAGESYLKVLTTDSTLFSGSFAIAQLLQLNGASADVGRVTARTGTVKWIPSA